MARPGPRFSVVVPAFNEAALLPACLQSLADQDFPGGYEVIVVDNNSADQTRQIAELHGATVILEQRVGVCWARQAGALAAVGEIIVSTDADTTFPRDWLSRIDKTFRESPDCVAVTGPCQFLDAPLWGRLYVWILFHAVALVSHVAGRVVYASATNIAFLSSAFAGYDTNATQGGDEFGLLRCLRSRGVIAFDLRNPSFTSARRLRQGLLYNVVVTFLYYYLVGYCLNRALRRPLIGMAPAFRAESPPVVRSRRFVGFAVASFAVVSYAAGRHWSILPSPDYDVR